jgi:hypothetical protein
VDVDSHGIAQYFRDGLGFYQDFYITSIVRGKRDSAPKLVATVVKHASNHCIDGTTPRISGQALDHLLIVSIVLLRCEGVLCRSGSLDIGIGGRVKVQPASLHVQADVLNFERGVICLSFGVLPWMKDIKEGDHNHFGNGHFGHLARVTVGLGNNDNDNDYGHWFDA